MRSLFMVHPGPAVPQPTNGLTATRGEATRDLDACWRAFRPFYGLD